ncbi:MAG: hypothetical protein NVSMB9_27940 [Isosphaeraceae bacterium]
MPTDKRRASARRRAWGRGPMILRFEPLEERQLLSSVGPDLVGAAFDTLHNLAWGDSFHAKGEILNQGDAPVSIPFHVDILASPTPDMGREAVLLGEVTIPAGLQPGEKAPFDQVVNLPNAPVNGVDSAGSLYVGLRIDPERNVPESNTRNNSGTGQGYDTSLVTITPHRPAALEGASLGAYPDQTRWGGTIRVNAQVHNNAAGDAPATRARLVLTPAGTPLGGPSDVTIANLDVPPVAAWQTATLSQNVTLPNYPPTSQVGSTQFILSIVQDADFVTNALSPHAATRDLGIDKTPLKIQLPADNGPSLGPKPDLTPASIKGPSLPLTPGQSFQVTATIQNQGNLDSGPFRVRFLLVGTNGTLDQALFLGDTTLNGLKAGYGQDIVETLKFPTRLPDGVALNPGSVGRIAIEIDPEKTLDESNKTNNVAVSNVVTLRLVNTDGNSSPVSLQNQGPGRQPNSPSIVAHRETNGTSIHANGSGTPNYVSRHKSPRITLHSAEHSLKVFPKRVSRYFRDTFKGH